ncbi:unnamed protein product [Ambrosiozyma monospora]|uniref:Unnamed protein product n=1 Tax=Ambrosiozyma monospora TaxID=43982 RepID=A0ACB5SXD5_AMBMO|nr:unnamed protein product [Ambrosiozyma monospora]
MSTSNGTPLVRAATHAGSWYTGSQSRLNSQLDAFLSKAPPTVPGARVVIGPHAGYSYAGPTLAQTYKAFDPTNIKRVFIMGPSHHVYFKGSVWTTGCDYYETPLGNVKVDTEVINELISKDSKMFKKMTLDADEDEHSFEMHMPFLYKVTQGSSNGVPKIIPIMVSGTDEKFEKKLADYLKPYFDDDSNAFIISTDFCHWGARFGYTAYTPDGTIENIKELSYRSKIPSSSLKIHESIEALDKKAMEVASIGSYAKFKKYIYATENTICGAKPLSILMALMEPSLTEDTKDGQFKWIGYTQSSKVVSPSDSSVSYASGYAVI